MSTGDQDPSLQLDALRRAGVDEDHLVVDHVSGASQGRGEDVMLQDRVASTGRLQATAFPAGPEPAPTRSEC